MEFIIYINNHAHPSLITLVYIHTPKSLDNTKWREEATSISTHTYRESKMGASILSLQAFFRLFLFSFITFCCLSSDFALASITRHYKFEVCVILSSSFCFGWFFFICLFPLISSPEIVDVLLVFKDQTAKCYKAVPYKEHRNSKWTVSWTSDCSEGGR